MDLQWKLHQIIIHWWSTTQFIKWIDYCMHQGTKGPSALVKEAGNIRNSLERGTRRIYWELQKEKNKKLLNIGLCAMALLCVYVNFEVDWICTSIEKNHIDAVKRKLWWHAFLVFQSLSHFYSPWTSFWGMQTCMNSTNGFDKSQAFSNREN